MVSESEGSFLGGLFKSPGIVAIAALGIGLFIFRKPITEAFAGLGGSISSLFSPSGAIQAAGAEAGQFVFNIGQEVGGAVFDAGAAAGQSVFDAGLAFGDFIGGTQNEIDRQLKNFFDSQKADLDNFISEFTQDVQEKVTDPIGTAISGDFDAIKAFLDSFGTFGQKPLTAQEQGILPFASAEVITSSKTDELIDLDPIFFDTLPKSTLDPNRPLDLFQFAEQFKIQPTEAFKIEKSFGGLSFQEIAAIPTFGEVLAENPDLTASQIANLKLIQAGGGGDFDFGTNTGLALELAGANFGSDVFLDRDDPSFALLKEAEALAAKESLGGFVGSGLFANPDFPITLGEAFLGKSGDIVSQSISNLTDEQLKDFIEQFG